MSALGSGRTSDRLLVSAALMVGFVAAVALRVAIGGFGAATSPVAGLVFAGCLLLLSLAAGTRLTAVPKDLLLGTVGAALICAPAALGHLARGSTMPGTAGFAAWAVVVCVVAAAEEVFLRGALYDALLGLGGPVVAVTLGAIAFALLHVPLYGWHVLPLDLAVGLVLGLVRHRAGSATAPAIAHVMADIAGWFLR